MSRTHKHDSSDVPLRGGLTRKSKEGSVMEPEQRGWMGTVNGQQQADWKNAQRQLPEEPYDGRLSRTVL